MARSCRQRWARALDVQLSSDSRGGGHHRIGCSRPQRLILVLDNCEHLTDTVAELIEAICAARNRRFRPTCHQPGTAQDDGKSTSFASVRIAVPVDGASADANQRGRRRAVSWRGALSPPIRASRRRHTRRRSSRSAAGSTAFPWPSRLAAARVPLLGVEGRPDAPGRTLSNVLTAGPRAFVLRRHQTLRATLEWSHGPA